VGGPTADFDHDGRIDVLVTGIDPAQPTMLLRGQAASKNWLEVSVADGPVDGVGTRVWVYRAGRSGDPRALIGAQEIVASEGYTAGVLPVAHFGLGAAAQVDVRVALPSGEVFDLPAVRTDRHLRLPTCD
jgi:enediyne biosynthesis protein E4